MYACMADPMEERSKEHGDTDVCEEMQVCDICGDIGYDNELAVCSRCNDSAEHIYCMGTMHDKVPLQWVCEQCELEEKRGSAKRRFGGDEPLSAQPHKKQKTSKLSSHSGLNEVKNIHVLEPLSKPITFERKKDVPSIPSAVFTKNNEPKFHSSFQKNITGEAVLSPSPGVDKRFSAVETFVKKRSNMGENLCGSLKGRPATEACVSTPKQREAVEAIKLQSPTLRGSSGCFKPLTSGETNVELASEIKAARESSVKGNIDTSSKDMSNCAKFPANGLLVGSKCSFSRSVSMKSYNDQPSFLLPSRPKNFLRSKSEVVRPCVPWIHDKGHHNELSHPMIYKHARQGTSCVVGGIKSTSPRSHKQAGQERNTEYERSSKDLESPCHKGHNFGCRKETNNSSPRGSDLFQHWGLNDKESPRCFRCGEVGHIDVGCKNMSSSKLWDWELSTGQTNCEKSMAARQSTPESPLGLRSVKEEGSLKRSWKDWESSRGPASSEKHLAARQSPPESPLGLCSNKEERGLKESLSWKLHGADSSGTSKPSSSTSQQVKNFMKDRLDRIDTVNSNKESASSRLHGADSSGAFFRSSSNTSQQIRSPGKDRLGRIDTMNSKKEEGKLKESSSWKSHGADTLGPFSKSSLDTSQQTKSSGTEWLGRAESMNMAVKLSNKSSENAKRQMVQVQAQKGNVAAASTPLIFVEIGKQVCSQSIVTSQQVQGADAMVVKHLQKCQPNPVVLSHVQNRCSSGTISDIDLAVDTSIDSYCDTRADPCIEILWSGCFNVSSNNCLTTYKGLQAHPSTKADPRIFEAIKTLPSEVYLEELKRGLETDTWPRSLQEQPPTSNSIGVYFFPVDMECHDIWYQPLLNHLSANDLALKTNLDWFQLLIFPSQLLPQAEQCWEDRQYLWGIIRKGSSYKSLSTAMPGVAL